MKSPILLAASILSLAVFAHPVAAQTLESALDWPGPWTTGGDGAWQAVDSPDAFDGVDLANLSGLAKGQEAWLETTLAESGTLSWRWRSDGVLAISIDGKEAFKHVHALRPKDGWGWSGDEKEDFELTDQWELPQIDLPKAGAVVRFTHIGGGSSDIDAFSLDPLGTPGVNTGVDATIPIASYGLELRTGKLPLGDMIDAAFGGARQNWIRSRVEGPGFFQSDGIAFLSGKADALFFFNQNLELEITGDAGGHPDEFGYSAMVPPGRHFVMALTGLREFSPGNGMWIDRWTWRSDRDNPVPLEEAVEGVGLEFSTGGDAIWESFQTSFSLDGEDSAWAPRGLEPGQKAWFETTMTGPGRLSFHWNYGESQDDLLRFHLDGVLAIEGGEPLWESESVTIPSGSHTARWEVEKSGDVPDQPASFRVDQIEYVPDSYLPWQQLTQLPADVAGLGDDPDGDELINLLEFATGGDPLDPSDGQPLEIGTAKNGQRQVVFTTPDRDLTGLRILLQTSPDLSTWTTAATLTEGDATATVPLPEGRVYVRLRVRLSSKIVAVPPSIVTHTVSGRSARSKGLRRCCRG